MRRLMLLYTAIGFALGLALVACFLYAVAVSDDPVFRVHELLRNPQGPGTAHPAELPPGPPPPSPDPADMVASVNR